MRCRISASFCRAAIGKRSAERLPNSRRKEIPVWLRQVIEILREEFDSKTPLAALAVRAGVHPVHLSREFRRHTDSMIGEFVRRVRIEKACRKLLRTNRELCDIAGKVGFYDQSHFTNTFKRVTGVTPAEYRATFRE